MKASARGLVPGAILLALTLAFVGVQAGNPQSPGDRRVPSQGCDARGATTTTGCHTWANPYDTNDSRQVTLDVTLGAHGDRVYAGGENVPPINPTATQDPTTLLVAYDAQTGALLWNHSAPGQGPRSFQTPEIRDIVTSPDGTTVYASAFLWPDGPPDGATLRTWAFEAATGTLQWTWAYHGGDPPDNHTSGEALAFTPDGRSLLVYNGGSDPSLHALNPETGTPRWSVTDLGNLNDGGCRGCMVVHAPANRVYLHGASADQGVGVAAVNLTTRSLAWSTAQGGTDGRGIFGHIRIAPKQGLVYTMVTQGLFERTGRITARTMENGSVAWTRTLPGTYLSLHLSHDQESLVVTGARRDFAPFPQDDIDAWIGALDAENGTTEWSRRHDGLGLNPGSDVDAAWDGFTLPDVPLSVVAIEVDSGLDGDGDLLLHTLNESTGQVAQSVRYSSPTYTGEELQGYRQIDHGAGTDAMFVALEPWRSDRGFDVGMVRYELDRLRPADDKACIAAPCPGPLRPNPDRDATDIRHETTPQVPKTSERPNPVRPHRDAVLPFPFDHTERSNPPPEIPRLSAFPKTVPSMTSSA